MYSHLKLCLISDMLASSPLRRESGSLSKFDMMDHVRLEKNGINVSYFPGEVSSDRISAIQVCNGNSWLLSMRWIVMPLIWKLYRKRTRVWRLPFTKPMELTTPIRKRFNFFHIYDLLKASII